MGYVVKQTMATTNQIKAVDTIRENLILALDQCGNSGWVAENGGWVSINSLKLCGTMN